jgi:hypothetical protein
MDDEFKKVTFSEPPSPVEEQEDTSFIPVTQEKSVAPMPRKTKSTIALPIIALVVVLMGVGTGFALSKAMPNKATQTATTTSTLPQGEGAAVETGKVYGSENKDKFPDTGIGVLEKGGIDGEGSHRLLKEGGPSQTMYLTSSVLDLDPFVGHKVEVWGETYAALKAAWLLDVGSVEVIELDAPKPFQEEPTEGAKDQSAIEE